MAETQTRRFKMYNPAETIQRAERRQNKSERRYQQKLACLFKDRIGVLTRPLQKRIKEIIKTPFITKKEIDEEVIACEMAVAIEKSSKEYMANNSISGESNRSIQIRTIQKINSLYNLTIEEREKTVPALKGRNEQLVNLAVQLASRLVGLRPNDCVRLPRATDIMFQ